MQDSTNSAILLGYSGHGFVVIEATKSLGIQIVGYAESVQLDHNPYKLTYLGDESRSDFLYWKKYENYILGVGSNRIREKIANRVSLKQGKCLTIIHPQASIAENLKIGSGTFIARNVAINPLVKVGENVILNTSCSIDHECRIENNVHIAPGAVLAGNVIVKSGVFVGANSVVKEGVCLGQNAVVGAGSVVIKDVEPNTMVVGNPARKISQ